MKRIFFIALLIVIGKSTTNAQIKVVDDNYSSSLTATKSYYDQDVEFESLFPKAYLGSGYCIVERGWYNSTKYNSIKMTIPKSLNCLGDTLWNYSNQVCPRYGLGDRMEIFGFGINTDGEKEEVTWEIPAGYYSISGYIIGRENLIELLSMHFSDEDTTRILHSYINSGGYEKITNNYYGIGKTPTIKQLKEALLTKKTEYLPDTYIAYVKLSSIDTINNKRIDYYAPRLSNLFNVKFYTELEKHFLNQEVLLLDNNYIRIDKNRSYLNTNGEELLFVEKDGIITDALSHEKIKIQDDAFFVKDVVVKLEKDRPSSEYEPHLYVVLEGKNTGSFAMQANSIQYIFDINCYMGNEHVFSSKSSFNYNIPHIKCLGSYNSNFYLMRESDLSTIKQFAIDTCNTINNKERMDKQKEENERLANQKRIEQDKRNKEEERRQRIILKYGEEMGALICDKKVAVGMTQEMCCDAWGRPMDSYRTTTKYGQSEVWCYNYKTRIYFFEGKVVQIDN